MFRTVVLALALVALAHLVRSHSMELNEQSPGIKVQRGVGTGTSKVWRSFDASHQLSNRHGSHHSNGNHFQNGWKSPVSVPLHREVIQSTGYFTYFEHYTTGVITYIEARDQSNGTGGYISSMYGGLNQMFVNVEFSMVTNAVSSIDFIVEIWGVPEGNVGVPAADFRIGELSPHSAWDISMGFDYEPLHEHDIVSISWAMTNLPERTFTFIEAFDLSPSGNGGIVRLIEGGIGQSYFQVGVQSVAPGVPVNVTFVAYSVDVLNGGQNFRLGTWTPGMKTLAYGFVEEDARSDEVLSGQFNYSNFSTSIGFVQGWDYVTRGTGGLVASAGGVGYSNVSLIVNSGMGEDLRMLVNVFGWEH